MALVILGLGSNVGDRARFLAEAIREIAAHVDALEYSPIYESEALLPEGAPKEWDTPFLNMALRGQTALEPEALLEVLKGIENKLGRGTHAFWSPREIDLDILAWDDIAYASPTLSIPHPELLNRDFALRPLADIAPGWRYPAEGPHKGKTAIGILHERGLDVGERLKRSAITLPMLR